MNWSELLMPNYGTPSVTFVKGSGTELFDKDGKRYKAVFRLIFDGFG